MSKMGFSKYVIILFSRGKDDIRHQPIRPQPHLLNLHRCERRDSIEMFAWNLGVLAYLGCNQSHWARHNSLN